MLEERQGLKIGCPEEIAFTQKFITKSQLAIRAAALEKSGYGAYLTRVVNQIESGQ